MCATQNYKNFRAKYAEGFQRATKEEFNRIRALKAPLLYKFCGSSWRKCVIGDSGESVEGLETLGIRIFRRRWMEGRNPGCQIHQNKIKFLHK